MLMRCYQKSHSLGILCVLAFFLVVLQVLQFDRLPFYWKHLHGDKKNELRVSRNASPDDENRTTPSACTEAVEIDSEGRVVCNIGQLDNIIRENAEALPARSSNKTAEELCSNSTDQCVPPFKAIETRVRVASNHKMMACIVQKSMSSMLEALMCFLHDEKGFQAEGRQFAKEYVAPKFCKGKNEGNAVHRVKQIHRIRNVQKEDWKFLMITRDPVDRFLSGFVDLCIRQVHSSIPCNGCRSNLTCFIVTEYERMVKESRSRPMERTFEDRHFFPQNWRCNLQREYKNFHFLRYASNPADGFLQELEPILVEQNVSNSSIDFIREQLMAGRTAHATVHSAARIFLETRLRSSPFLMEHLVKMFYHDFKLFNYEFPPGFY